MTLSKKVKLFIARTHKSFFLGGHNEWILNFKSGFFAVKESPVTSINKQ